MTIASDILANGYKKKLCYHPEARHICSDAGNFDNYYILFSDQSKLFVHKHMGAFKSDMSTDYIIRQEYEDDKRARAILREKINNMVNPYNGKYKSNIY